MAFDSILNCVGTIRTACTAKKAAAGLNARQQSDAAGNPITWTLGTGAGQINEAYFALLTIAGAGNTTLDLTALTDQLGNALTFTAVKEIQIQLLGTADKSTDGTTVGTACSGITVGNAASNQFAGTGYPISDQATGTVTLGNREQTGRINPSAAGWVVDATHKLLKINNNDGVNSAKVLVAMLGLG